MADTALDDVVVNGFYTKNKNTFTGSVTTVKGRAGTGIQHEPDPSVEYFGAGIENRGE